MRLLAFDSIGGAAGDMILASLIDLGVDAHQLVHDLESLGIGHFRIDPQPCSAAGLHGLRLSITLPDPPAASPPDHGHEHAHGGGSAHVHAHEHDHSHAREHDHSHPADAKSGNGPTSAHPHPHDHPAADASPHSHTHGGRGLREIHQIIDASDLPQAVKADSCAIFLRLAQAEGRVHQCDPETIHFHEVGALDSILDIVGCCLARYRLGVDAVQVSPLPLGRGFFKCDHGILPIPAPATVELLRDFPVHRTDEPYELVTPTGAAILSTWRTLDTASSTAHIMRTGHGFGSRTLQGRPNLLRAMLMDVATPPHGDTTPEACLELVCNLDDMTPEWIGPLIPRLLEAGALDAFTTAIQMKKQRPGCLLTVLCRPDDRPAMLDLLFAETTTFGVRWRWMDREVLVRRQVTVTTPYGPVTVKIGRRGEVDRVFAPEYEDCRRQAAHHHVSVRDVHAAALVAVRTMGDDR